MSYPGGKSGAGVYQAIINQMPPHETYIEPFLGLGGVLRRKRPAAVNIGIDCDGAVLARWRGDEVPGLQLVRADALAWLTELVKSGGGGPGVLVYLDPPYLMATRSTKQAYYRHEFATEQQHKALLGVVQDLSRAGCLVMISGYWSELYGKALVRWRPVQFQAQTRAGKTAVEWLWMNFPEPAALHDYAYLGTNYRERERIKRKQARWRARLAGMDELERAALLAALGEAWGLRVSSETAGAPGQGFGSGTGINGGGSAAQLTVDRRGV